MFRPPYEVLLVVTLNGSLAAGALVLPSSLRDLFYRLHRTVGFAIVLATWMIADVTATNLLAADRERFLLAIDDPGTLRRLMLAKNLVLSAIVALICVPVAIGIGLFDHDPFFTFVSVIWVLVVPAGALGASSWLGTLAPYHPIALRERWARRDEFGHMIFRWLVLLFTPYAIVPAIAGAISAIPVLIWTLLAPHHVMADRRISHLVIVILVAIAISTTASIWGRKLTCALVALRRAALVSYLADPARG